MSLSSFSSSLSQQLFLSLIDCSKAQLCLKAQLAHLGSELFHERDELRREDGLAVQSHDDALTHYHHDAWKQRLKRTKKRRRGKKEQVFSLSLSSICLCQPPPHSSCHNMIVL